MESPILRLPFDFIQDVLAQLVDKDHDSFLALRSTCRICRQQSEVFLFRELRLRGDGATVEERLLRRLGDTQDHLAARIQKLVLELLTTERVGHLLEVLESGRLQRLKTVVYGLTSLSQKSLTNNYSWKTHLEMPRGLLLSVESQSHIELHVINNERRDVPMQMSLLSSPSLQRLDYTIYVDFDLEDFSGWRTEFLAFKNLLLQARNLRGLSLDTKWCSDKKALPNFGIVRDQLYFAAGDCFPALEELTLSGSGYHHLYLYGDVPKRWVQCTDFSHLKHLDLGSRTQPRFIEALTGHVPLLRSLTFGMMGDEQSWSSCSRYIIHFEETQRFLQSIIALERVTLWSGTSENSESSRIRQILLEEHGASLKYFDLKYHSLTPNLKSPNFEPLDAEQLQQLVKIAPDLQELKVTAIICQRHTQLVAKWNYVKPAWAERVWNWFERLQWDLEAYPLLRYLFGRRVPRARIQEPFPSVYKPSSFYWKNLFDITFWPFKTQQTVFQLRSLRHLTLCIHMRHEVGLWYQFATRCCPDGPYDVNEEFARHTVMALFSKFGPDSAIAIVTLEFKADRPEEVVWSYTAQRKPLCDKSKHRIVVKGSETRVKTHT